MILQSLIDYYQRLENDPSGHIAPFGYRPTNVTACIVLKPNGHFVDVHDLREQTKYGPRSIKLQLPYFKTRTSGEWPNFLWDHTEYVLGIPVEGDVERAQRRRQMFIDLHRNVLKAMGSSRELESLLLFQEHSLAAAVARFNEQEELVGGNLVLRLSGGDNTRYFHDTVDLRAAWADRLKWSLDTTRGVSLIHGGADAIADIHPLILGVRDTNQNKGALVSFNKDKLSFNSYRKERNFNAPVGVQDAFRYATALNHMLADERHRSRLGDATVVFWSDRPTVFESAFSHIINDFAGSGPAEDSATTARVQGFLEAMHQGRPHDGLDEPKAKFFVLGLSPNAARVSVRFWLVGTVEQFAERLAQHFSDLEMTGEPPNNRPWSLQLITDQTARDRKDVAPQLAGEVARAILSGSRYPAALYSAVLRRIRADQTIHYHRAAILKAHLTREARLAGLDKEIPVSLNKERCDPAYLLGRLFAALEKTQTDSAKPVTLNRTVKDGYMTSAASTPSTVFPRLLSLHQRHVEKLPETGEEARQRRCRTKRYYQVLVRSIMEKLDDWPRIFSLEEQGLFYIGYYHQHQDFFTKREDTAETEPLATTEA